MYRELLIPADREQPDGGQRLSAKPLREPFLVAAVLAAWAPTAPVLLYLSTAVGCSAAAGTQTAIWICLAIAIAGVVGTVTLFVLGAERPQAPDLTTWTDDGELAWDSTPLLIPRGLVSLPRSPATVHAAAGRRA